MRAWSDNQRNLRLFFVLAVVVHVAVVMIPITKKLASPADGQRSVTVTLSPAIQPIQPDDRRIEPPVPQWRDPQVPNLEELPPAPGARAVIAEEKAVQQTPIPSGKRVLSRQFDLVRPPQDPFLAPVSRAAESSDYYPRFRPSLEQALNQPSLQLPFEDTRIYLVDHYENGIMGGIEKFWDNVSVPFGFTTKNNTRVQCVWVLVIAGCGWGHQTLFNKKARYRERPATVQPESS